MLDCVLIFSGRVLNRFSKDTGHMDDNLPITFFDYIQVGPHAHTTVLFMIKYFLLWQMHAADWLQSGFWVAACWYLYLLQIYAVIQGSVSSKNQIISANVDSYPIKFCVDVL